MVIEPTDMESLKTKFESIGVDIQAGPGTRWGSHGDGMSLYIYDPDDNVVELRPVSYTHLTLPTILRV